MTFESEKVSCAKSFFKNIDFTDTSQEVKNTLKKKEFVESTNLAVSGGQLHVFSIEHYT